MKCKTDEQEGRDIEIKEKKCSECGGQGYTEKFGRRGYRKSKCKSCKVWF